MQIKTMVVIDIGSNSMRLVLGRIGPGKAFKIINDIKESVRLEEGMGKESAISSEKMDHAARTLKMFKHVIEATNPDEVIAVATEAVRRASNGGEFIRRLKDQTGIDVRILSGEEEAYYDYLGVVNSLDYRSGLIMDIGGGSTELVWVEDRDIRERVSLPFGAINLTQRFGLSDHIDQQKENGVRQYINETYKNVPWLKKVKHKRIIGVGGTMRNLGKIDRKRKNYPLDLAHNYRMSAGDLTELYDIVASRSLVQRREINGLSRDRTDIIVGATCAVQMLAKTVSAQELIISGSGLREGLIYHYLMQNGHAIDDVLDYSIENNIDNYGLYRNHAEHVYRNASTLFEQMASLHQLEKSYLPVLKTAAMLHDCGITLKYYGHDKHSFYMTIHSEINGLSHRELVLAAYVMAAFGKEKDRPDFVRFRGLLNKTDEEAVMKLGILLRIARSLDRSMNGIIEGVHCEVQKDAVIIKTTARDNPEFEIREGLKWSSSFKRIYKKNLYIV